MEVRLVKLKTEHKYTTNRNGVSYTTTNHVLLQYFTLVLDFMFM